MESDATGLVYARRSAATLDTLPAPLNNPVPMQATLTIDDELLEIAKRMAVARSVSIDAVISDLIRKGLQNTTLPDHRNGLPVFRVPADARTITSADVRRAEDEP